MENVLLDAASRGSYTQEDSGFLKRYVDWWFGSWQINKEGPPEGDAIQDQPWGSYRRGVRALC